MSDEPKYTLDVARKLVQRERCADVGHEILRNVAGRSANGRATYDFYACEGCDVTITLTYPPLEGA